MSRPVAVTASAVVAILGSIFTLLMAALSVASLFIATAQPRPHNSAQIVIAGALLFVAFAGLGIWTSVGLFRLRSWARTSVLIFAGFLAAVSIFSLLVTMAVPMPGDMSADTVRVFRWTMVVTFGIPLVIAVWWLMQFNTQSTKAAFASPGVEPASLRPLSITVIAWASILGGASGLIGILARAPAFLFGLLFTGWTATAIYAALGALSLYIGKGLLDLRERARVLAIAWFAFSFVHMGLVTFVPSMRQGMLDFQLTLAKDQAQQAQPIAFDPGMLINLSFAFAAIVAAAAIWFLVRSRPAFARAENA
jgi:hypothetical protein